MSVASGLAYLDDSSIRVRVMQNQLRGRSLADRLTLSDEVDNARSPSYFEWREQTITTKAYKPTVQVQSKGNSLVRLFRRFA